MADYLAYSHRQVQKMMPMADWSALSADQHESLAAFRVRFSEYQEHLGKTMRAIAIEEEAVTEPFGAVLALMEKLGVLDSVEHWKLIRDLRNAINHEYEENPDRLSEFFSLLIQETPTLNDYHQRMVAFCQASYKAQIGVGDPGTDPVSS
jgi:glutamine synthetase adenylyltransferase